MDDFSEGRNLCYGDRIIFEISDLEGCEYGGIFGVQELKYSNEFLSLEEELQKVRQYNTTAVGKVSDAQRFSEAFNDVTRKRYFGFSEIGEKSGVLHPPSDFYLNNIFEIVAGVGFEACGEPVFYGSQVKLKLVSTQEYLFAGSEQIYLLRQEDFEHSRLKECNFRIKPCHKVRLDGEKVFYNDLIVLLDHKGRELLPINKNKVTFRPGNGSNKGIRIGIYLSTSNLVQKGIYGGEILQLYHRVENSYLVASPLHGDFQKIRIAAQVEELTFLQNSVSLWQVETIAAGERRLKADGNIFQCTPIRLRHIMSNKLLRYSERQGFILVSEPDDILDDPTIFEFRVNFDALHEEDTVGVSGLRITYDTPVRLFHLATQSYVIVRKDAKAPSKTFLTTYNNFDKDIFQLFPVSSELIGTVLSAKRLRLGMSLVQEKLIAPNLPRYERNNLIQMASKFLSICVGEGSFLSRSSLSLKEKNSVTHLIANEFGFIDVLLQLTQIAFQHGIKVANSANSRKNTQPLLSKDEELLAKSAYHGISSMLKMDSSSCYPIVKGGGVSLMVKHFSLIHPQLNWNPPLIELADAINSESSKPEVSPILAFNEEEVRMLLDKVHQQILEGSVPNIYTYELLTKACAGSCELVTNQVKGVTINQTMQMMVAEQLLGSPHETMLSSPCWSILVYKPLIEEDLSMFQRKTVEFSKRFRFLLCTSPMGQKRPFHNESLPLPSMLRPPNLSMEACSDEEYLQCLDQRNQHFSPYYHWKDPIAFNAKISMLKLNSDSKFPFVMRELFQSVPWKTIPELSLQELKFFIANLKLVSALCIGRNIWCQRIVRKLYPVDHILVLLDSLKEHSSLTQNNMNPVTASLLTSLKTRMISLLHTCYVDSAFLPTLSLSQRESIIEISTMREKKNKHWDDILNEECRFKVLSLFSQLDCELLEMSVQMNPEDLGICIDHLPDDGLKELLKNAGFLCGFDECFEKQMLEAEILKSREGGNTLQVRTEPIESDPDTPLEVSLPQKLKILGKGMKQYYAARSIHSFEQRALLMKILMDFIQNEAFMIWNDLIQKPYVEIIASKEHIAFDPPILALLNNRSKPSDEYREVEEEITEIRRHLHLLEGYFALIKSLSIRGFFSYEYNANPTYFDSKAGVSKLFYEHFDQTSFAFQPCLTYDERTIQVLRCIERIEDRTVSLETIGDLYGLRQIALSVMKIFSTRPGQRLHLSLCNMNEDEKNIDEYFNRQYGYSQDRYHLSSGVMKVKLSCCRVLSTIIDVFQVKTEKELEKVFNQLFVDFYEKRQALENVDSINEDHIGEEKSGDEESGTKSTVPPNVKKFSQYLRQRMENLSYQEIQSLQKQLQISFNTYLARNADLIWNVPELFQETSFHIFLHQLLDNDAALRSEILSLLYRMNARRSEMNELMSKEIRLYQEVYSPTVLYFNRQKIRLQEILTRFSHCFDLTVPGMHDSFISVRNAWVLNKLLFYGVKLKKLLLNNDEVSGDLGLINYCYFEAIDPGDVLMRKSRLHTDSDQEVHADSHKNNLSFTPLQPSRRTIKTASTTSTGGASTLMRSMINRTKGRGAVGGDNHTAADPTHSPPEIHNPNIHINSTIEDILQLPLNEAHVKEMLPFNFHKLIIDFIIDNQSSFNADSALYKYYLTAETSMLMTEEFFPPLKIMRYLLMFLRCFMNGSLRSLRSVLSRPFLSALFEMKYCVPEATEVLLMILTHYPNQGFVDFINEQHFHSLLDDLKYIIQYPELFVQQKKHLFGCCSVEKICRLIQLLCQNDHNHSSKFMSFFNLVMTEMITYRTLEDHLPAKQYVFQRILSIGIDIESETNVPPNAHTATNTTTATTAAPTTGNLYKFTKLDIRMTCFRYQKETNRITFSRLPKDILADPYLNETIYLKLKKALEVWKLLPDQSLFALHLYLLRLIARSAVDSISLQDLYRTAFSSQLTMWFDLLFLDKYEVKLAYLLLFRGVYFSRKIDEKITVPIELMNFPKIQIYMKALLKMLTQDMKLYLLFLKDPELALQQENEGGKEDERIAGDRSQQLLPGPTANVLRHARLQETYIKEAVLPFLVDFFRSNLYERLHYQEVEEEEEEEEDNEAEEEEESKEVKDTEEHPESNTAPGSSSSGRKEATPATHKPLQRTGTASKRDPSEPMEVYVHAIIDTIGELLMEVSGSFLNECNMKGLMLLMRSLKEAMHSPEKPLLYVSKSIHFLEQRDKLIKTFARPHHFHHPIPSLLENDDAMSLKRKCLMEFIPEVDRLAMMYGYSTLDHLLKTPHRSTFFFFEREYAQRAFNTLAQFEIGNNRPTVNTSAQTLTKLNNHQDPLYHVITNPLNCETFEYTVREISRLIVAHSKFAYPERFELISKLMHRIPNNQEDRFLQYWNPYIAELENFSVETFLDRGKNKMMGSSSTFFHFGHGDLSLREEDLEKFSQFQFLRWTKYGGMIVSLILTHLDYSLRFYQGRGSLFNASYTLKDLTKCNAYWVHTMTKGLLQSHIHNIFEKYAEQTEIQLKQLEVEGHRLSLIQDILCDLGAPNLIVKQLSVPQRLLGNVISTHSIDSVYAMAIEFGSSLNENGNVRAQNLFIEAIETELRVSTEQGYNYSFVKVVRKLLQSYSVLFQSRESLNMENVSKAVNLLRMLQLFCERHNEKAQVYLGEHQIVTEVAAFVNDIALLLSRELSDAFVTDEELLPRDQPEILGIKRSIIRWINPLPEGFRLNLSAKTRAESIRKMMSRRMPAVTTKTPFPSSTSKIVPTNHSPKKPLSGNSEEEHDLDQSLHNNHNNHSNSHPHRPASPPEKAPEPSKFLDLNRIKLLAELVTAGLEALTEFCQGPRAEIQVMIARSGVTTEFNTFFKFFGALQLLAKVDFDTKTPHQIHQLKTLFHHHVKCRATSETLLETACAMDDPEELYWIGNDPLALLIILASIHEDRNSSAMALGSVKAKPGHSPIQEVVEISQEQLGDLPHLCYQFWTCQHHYYEDDIYDLEREFQTVNHQRAVNPMLLEDFAQWSQEKRLFLEYRKRKEKMTQRLTSNYYEMITDFEEHMVSFERSCLTFLSSLIEAFSNVEKEKLEIPAILLNDIEKEHLVCNMANYWQRYLYAYRPIIAEGDIRECYERQLAYRYYILLNQFTDLSAKEITGNLDELMTQWLTSCHIPIDQHIARIEVRSPNDPKSLVVSYFPVPSVVQTYWSRGEIVEYRDHILYPNQKGTRDSIDEKVKNFLKDGAQLILTLRHVESLDEIIAPKSYFHRFIVNLAHNYKRWNFGTFVFTIALNFLLLASVRLNDDQSSYYEAGINEIIIYYLGWAHLFCTGLTFFSFMVMFGWLYIKMGLQANEKNEFEFRGYFLSRLIYGANHCGLIGTWREAELVGNKVAIRVWRSTAAIGHLLTHSDVLYFIALLFFSLLGNLLNTLFFSLCLMEFLRISQLMRYVTSAFTNNIGQVLATLGLAAILLYLFSTFSFSYSVIRNEYYFNGFGNGGCTSLQNCFRLHIDYGLLQSVFWDYPNEIQTWQGEIFNFLFTFIMQIVIPGLISGIIIDSFSQMRGEKQDIEDDVQNTCFICNIDREDFESMNISFEHHIKNEHNLWKYLWFVIYLFEKDITDFDGIESFCHQIIEAGDFSTRWLPVKMARALVSLRDKYDLFTIYNKITTLQNMMDRFGSTMKADLYKTEKHLKEHFKEELGQIETHTREIAQRLEKRSSNREGFSHSRSGGAGNAVGNRRK